MLEPMVAPFKSPLNIRGLRRIEYEKLGEMGLLTKDDRCELLEGQLVVKPVMGGPHRAVMMRLAMVLRVAAERMGMEIVMGAPFAATDDSEPEPDLALVTRAAAISMKRHPSEATLIIEVCHSSDYNDRVVKPPIYARAKVPEYWVVDVDDKTIEIYTNPRARSYGDKRLVSEGLVSPLALPDARVDLVALFADD